MTNMTRGGAKVRAYMTRMSISIVCDNAPANVMPQGMDRPRRFW